MLVTLSPSPFPICSPNPTPRPTQPDTESLETNPPAAPSRSLSQPQQAKRQQPTTGGTPNPYTLLSRQGGPSSPPAQPQRQTTRQQRQERMLANAVPGLNADSAAAAFGNNPGTRTTQHPNLENTVAHTFCSIAPFPSHPSPLTPGSIVRPRGGGVPRFSARERGGGFPEDPFV